MGENFHNRADWLTLALAMVIWAAHFMLVWTASSVFPGHPAARWMAVGLSFLAFSVLFCLWRWRQAKTPRSVAGLGIALAAGGIGYNLLPAIAG